MIHEKMTVRKMAILGLLMSATLTMVAQQARKPNSAKARNPRKVDTYRVSGTAAYGDSLKPDAVIAKALRNVPPERIRQKAEARITDDRAEVVGKAGVAQPLLGRQPGRGGRGSDIGRHPG